MSAARNMGSDGPDPAETRALELFLAAPAEQAFEDVCTCLTPRMMRYFRFHGCDTASAEELTQDVLFTVFRHAATLRDRSAFRGWLYTVARNCLLQRSRKARRRVPTVGLAEIAANAKEISTEPVDQPSEFDRIVASLPPEDRELLHLRFVEELEYEEIAAVLRIPAGTAKWRVFNSKLKLALQMGRVRK